jgi:hypothetical protein
MTEQTNPNDLNVQDLATMKAIIDLASERNAFKPGEMAAVGIVYNKLDVFLKGIEEQQKAAKAVADAKAVAEAEATEMDATNG